MTSSNGNIFRVTGPLCGEFTGPGDFPTQRPVTRSFDVFVDLRLNKRLSKRSRDWWFETLSRPLWRLIAYQHSCLLLHNITMKCIGYPFLSICQHVLCHTLPVGVGSVRNGDIFRQHLRKCPSAKRDFNSYICMQTYPPVGLFACYFGVSQNVWLIMQR